MLGVAVDDGKGNHKNSAFPKVESNSPFLDNSLVNQHTADRGKALTVPYCVRIFVSGLSRSSSNDFRNAPPALASNMGSSRTLPPWRDIANPHFLRGGGETWRATKHLKGLIGLFPGQAKRVELGVQRYAAQAVGARARCISHQLSACASQNQAERPLQRFIAFCRRAGFAAFIVDCRLSYHPRSLLRKRRSLRVHAWLLRSTPRASSMGSKPGLVSPLPGPKDLKPHQL